MHPLPALHHRLEYLPVIGWLLDPDIPSIPDPVVIPLTIVFLALVAWPRMDGSPPDHVQRMLEALRTISNSHKSAESYAALLQGQRDRLIAEIRESTSLTLREIAAWAGMHHTRVGKILRKPTMPLYKLLTPEIPDWNFVTREEVIQFLTTHYQTEPPPTNAEIQSLLDDHAALVPSLEGQAPAWPWWREQVYDVFGRAITDRPSVHVLELLGVARVMMLSATWRAAATGKNQAPDLVERGMNLATRLLVEITGPVDPGDT